MQNVNVYSDDVKSFWVFNVFSVVNQTDIEGGLTFNNILDITYITLK